ncbi:MAG: T9SS type A sorting domain-containing protein, partial [Bacteroidia bacterium]|nr:T9SS type A sorting domain-containing protein [Bacteroidia bacterium]
FLNGLWASDFYVKNDSVYTSLFVTNAPDQTSYAITDTSFNIIYSSPTISIEGMAHCSILPTTNNRVALYSYGDVTSVGFQFGNGANCFSSLTMLNRFSGTNYKNDIALVSLTVDSLYHTGFTNSPSGSVNIKARVMVKNKGTTAITQFDLSCYEYTSIDGCNKYYYNERFSNLNILPGDSIEVTTGSFVTKYYPTITGGNPYTISSDYCFYTSVPDNEVDKTMLNNQFCKNVSFTVTGMDETSSLENSFKVFPNPTENDFAITSSAFIRSVEAYNIHGELICRQILAAHETIIGNDFKSGIYFLRINTDKGSVTRKIIKN